jgi:hypothetical protein
MANARHLVIVRAGDSSLHPAWTHAPATRDWDLVVSYFGADRERYRDDSGLRIDDRGLKFPGLHALLARESFWRDYDYIWLPDDDLRITQEGVGALFAEMAALDLELAQPALSWASYYSHAFTLRHPSFRARYTNFVEIMAPCFRRDLLEACVPALAESISGWGLDWVFPRRCRDPARGAAILDSVTMTHTRPVGGPTYAVLRERGITAADERDALLARQGIVPGGTPIVGAVTGAGAVLDRRRADDAVALDALLAADRHAILAAAASIEVAPVRFTLERAPGPRRWGS